MQSFTRLETSATWFWRMTPHRHGDFGESSFFRSVGTLQATGAGLKKHLINNGPETGVRGLNSTGPVLRKWAGIRGHIGCAGTGRESLGVAKMELGSSSHTGAKNGCILLPVFEVKKEISV